MRIPRGLAVAALAAWLAAGRSASAAEERALYLAEGEDVRLFDHYDNDGYSLEVEPAAGGAIRLRVRVDDAPNPPIRVPSAKVADDHARSFQTQA